MVDSEKRVYVVVVNFNGGRDTLECLESLLASPAKGLHVLIVDNASSDDSREQITRWAGGRSHTLATLQAGDAWPANPNTPLSQITLIESRTNRGFSGGNNAAMTLLQSRGANGYVWLLNNDMVVEPTTLDALLRAAQADGVGAVGGLLLEYDRPGTLQAIAGGSVSWWNGMTSMLGAGQATSGAISTALPVDFISGGCLFTHTDVIAKVGLLDEAYFLYSEDVDWCTRMRSAGYRLAYSVDARVRHKGGASVTPQSPLHDYHTVRGALLFVRAHARGYLPAAFVYSIYRCLLPKVVRGEWSRARAVLRAYADYAAGARRAASTSM